MNRLHIAGAQEGETTTVSGESLCYLRDVLRMRPGDPIEVFDGRGGTFASTLTRYVEDGALIALGEREERPFAGVRIVLLQGLPKADKFELVVQKAVELGISSIVPVVCERSVVKLGGRKAADRVARWQKIAEEAARQSRRADVPVVEPVTDLSDVLRRENQARRLVLDEDERTRRLRDALGSSTETHQLLIGPEGGLTRDEVRAATQSGFVPVTLGPRILRTETAGLAAVAAIQFALGDLG